MKLIKILSLKHILLLSIAALPSFTVEHSSADLKKNVYSGNQLTWEKASVIQTENDEFEKIKKLSREISGENATCTYSLKNGKCCKIACKESIYVINDGTKIKYKLSVFDAKDCEGKRMVQLFNLETGTNDIVSSIDAAFEKIKVDLSTKDIKSSDHTQSEPTKTIYTIVEEQAEFPGGLSAMQKFIVDNTKVPGLAGENTISGRCYVNFVVNEDGTLSDILILKGMPGCKGCDDEAMRVVKSMPNWRPGKMNGKPVAVYYQLPIVFRTQ